MYCAIKNTWVEVMEDDGRVVRKLIGFRGPNELEEGAITRLGNYDGRDYYIYMRGGEPVHEDIAAVYKGIIRRMANECLM